MENYKDTRPQQVRLIVRRTVQTKPGKMLTVARIGRGATPLGPEGLLPLATADVVHTRTQPEAKLSVTKVNRRSQREGRYSTRRSFS